MHLHFRKYGEGPPLIILHGLFGSSDNWHTLARRWGQYFTVYAVDQRNHGSSPHEFIMNYDEMTQDLHDFIQQHRIERPYLLGHSMGGKVGMLYSSTHADNVSGLVVLDIGVEKVIGEHTAILNVLRNVEPADYPTRAELEIEFKKDVASPAIRQFLLKNILRRVDGTFSWKFNRDALLDHYEDLTASLDLSETFMEPVLFLRGENSNYLGASLPPDILQYFPLAQLISIRDAGHWLHADQPEVVFNQVCDFFSDN